jgi:hypothetical protein
MSLSSFVRLFGQALSIVSVSLLAVESLADISLSFLTGLLEVQLGIALLFYKHDNHRALHFTPM